jgi:hypothetical protein
MIKKFNEFTNESRTIDYDYLSREDSTIDELYDFLSNNYKPIEDKNEDRCIQLIKTQGFSPEIRVPITLSGDYIFTQNDVEPGEDNTKIWCVYFTDNLKEYVLKKYPDGQVEDKELLGDDATERVFLNGDDYILCSQVVEFIDYLLEVVPDPALRNK